MSERDDIYPLFLAPVMAERPWGRPGASPFFDPEVPRTLSLGEVWLLADRPGGVGSKISNGAMNGAPIERLRRLWGAGLLGPALAKRVDEPFPAEIKILRTGTGSGPVFRPATDLYWQILGIEEESFIGAGLMAGLDFRSAKREAGLLPHMWPDLLVQAAVEPGQLFRIPKGCPVFLGPDLTVLEISVPAGPPDFLYDWDRERSPLKAGPGDAAPAPRLSDQDYAPPASPAPRPAGQGIMEFFRTPGFVVESLEGEVSEASDPEGPLVIVPILGQGRLRSQGPVPASRLTPGRAVWLPPPLGRYTIETNSFLSCWRVSGFGQPDAAGRNPTFS